MTGRRSIKLRWWAAAALIVAAGVGIAVFAAPVASRWLPGLVAAAGALGALAVPAAAGWKKIRAARAKPRSTALISGDRFGGAGLGGLIWAGGGHGFLAAHVCAACPWVAWGWLLGGGGWALGVW